MNTQNHSSHKPTIVFSSKCWQGDYHHFLSGAFERKYKGCQYPFNEKWLMVNNITDDVKVEDLEHLADRVVDVGGFSEEVLKFFNLKKEDFKGGYYYSIAELTAIYLAKDFDYLCWIQGDCTINPPGDWITEGIEVLEKNKDISVVSPFSENNTWHDENYLDHFFSDQGYLIRVNEFRKRIYNYQKPFLEQYPDHGGISFERMCGRYLFNTGKFRRILIDFNLNHPTYE